MTPERQLPPADPVVRQRAVAALTLSLLSLIGLALGLGNLRRGVFVAILTLLFAVLIVATTWPWPIPRFSVKVRLPAGPKAELPAICPTMLRGICCQEPVLPRTQSSLSKADRISARARETRDLTVPSGIPRTSATS